MMIKKPWPLSMIIAAIVGWLGIAAMGGYAISDIAWVMSQEPTGNGVVDSSLTMVVAATWMLILVTLVATVALAIPMALVMARFRAARVVYTVFAGLEFLALFGLVALSLTSDDSSLHIPEAWTWMLPSVGVAAGAILMWIPASAPFFCRTPQQPPMVYMPGLAVAYPGQPVSPDSYAVPPDGYLR